MKSRSHTSCLAALLVSLAPALAGAETIATPAVSLDRCTGDDAARVRFIEDRLDSRRTYADYWWKGWMGAYGLGTVIEAVQASTHDDEGRKADYAVSAGKALFGTVRVALSPPTARVGADPMRSVEPVDAATCRQRVEVGEELLRKNAKESESRWDWKRHAANVAINVAGGIIVSQAFDEDRGWASAGVGIAVGELMTFSHPWRGDDDLTEYEQKFGGLPPAQRVSFSITPWQQGARFLVRF
jgi:hypothetical protein